jgi:hypothetical protein
MEHQFERDRDPVEEHVQFRLNFVIIVVVHEREFRFLQYENVVIDIREGRLIHRQRI